MEIAYFFLQLIRVADKFSNFVLGISETPNLLNLIGNTPNHVNIGKLEQSTDEIKRSGHKTTIFHNFLCKNDLSLKNFPERIVLTSSLIF